MILLDTSGLLAALDRAERANEPARAVLDSEAGPLVLSPFVLAEMDYLLATRRGVETELAFLREVERGAYELVTFDSGDVAQAREIIESYRDLGISLTDASIVVLAAKLGTKRLLTLDEQHFRALRTPQGKPFTLLPADA